MQFTYQAKTTAGELLEGTIDAVSEDQAILSLHQKNLFVLSLAPKDARFFKADLLAFFNRPSRKDLVLFTRQLATLIDADVPLLEAVSTLGRQAEKESFRKMILSIAGAIEGGTALSVALAEHERVFNKFYTSLVRVGEVSGKLQETLLYLADYLERSADLNSKIKSALFYPVFVLISLVIVGVIMMTTVIPQLLTIIRDSGVTELPLPTRALIGTSSFFQHYALVILIVLILGVIGIAQYLRTSQGKMFRDRLLINIPKFGRIIRSFYIARISETLATLVRSSVPILDSIHITSEVVGNEVYRGILLEAEQNIRSGDSLSATLAEHREFPTLVSSMLETGERTGRTEAILGNILKFYRTEAEQSVQNIAQLIEPLLILILGIGIGLLVAAVLLPIYSLINVA